MFGPRREIRKNLVESGFAESGTSVAATANERDIDAQVFFGPLD